MNIAIIGAGAMGSIYGGHLSTRNNVFLIDTNAELVEKINKSGITITENKDDIVYHPNAVTNTDQLGEMDLVILFVKSLYSEVALKQNKNLIGESTYLMTLQNGSGHEEILNKFVPLDRVIIGTTEDNGAVLSLGHVGRGGEGKTNVGMLNGDKTPFLEELKKTFDASGFKTVIHDNIQQLVWDKLLRNVSLSAVTGVLQCKIGYIYENKNAWEMVKQLLKEAIEVAHGLGLEAKEEVVLEQMKKTAINSSEGITSISADITNGRKTEVDSISGSVVRAAKQLGIDVPTHRFVVNSIHALENRRMGGV